MLPKEIFSLFIITTALGLIIPRVEEEATRIVARVHPGTFTQPSSPTPSSSSSSISWNETGKWEVIGLAGVVAIPLLGWLCKEVIGRLRNPHGQPNAGHNGSAPNGAHRGPNSPQAPVQFGDNDSVRQTQPTMPLSGPLPTGQELRTNDQHPSLQTGAPQLPPLVFGDAQTVDQEWPLPLPPTRLPPHTIGDPAV